MGERVRVAAEARFAGIGLPTENYWQALDAGLDDATMFDRVVAVQLAAVAQRPTTPLPPSRWVTGCHPGRGSAT